MDTIFSDNLKKFRQQKNLTQEQAAEVLGVNTQTVSRWECNTTQPDLAMLPQIAKLYCVTIDDLFKKTAVAYDNYAQRLSCVYEATRQPEDFISADFEFKKMMKTDICSAEDLRCYGVMHHFMMRYCIDKAVTMFDKVLEQGEAVGRVTYWRTKHQKMSLCAEIGRSQENIDEALAIVNDGSKDPEDWMCLIAAYQYSGDEEKAYEWFLKALPKFPDEAGLYAWGGDVCKSLKRYDEAFQYWRKSLELDGEMDNARYSMGFCYEELGEYGKAHDMWLEIARGLEKDGCDIEKQFPLERAEKCKAILTNHPA